MKKTIRLFLFILSVFVICCSSSGGDGGSGSGTIFAVTYNANGATSGTVPSDMNNYTRGQIVTVLPNTGNLAKTGYSYNGWNTAVDGSGTTYTQSQTFPMGSASITLYAKWTSAPTYTITYDANGATEGTVPVDTTNYISGQTVAVLGDAGNLVKPGYVFDKWNTQADGRGTTYTQGQTLTMGMSGVTLYVVWTLAPGELDPMFNVNGAGANTTVKSVVMQQDGKILIGGFFQLYNGKKRDYIARLNSDGTLDTGFMATGYGPNDAVECIAVQTDGKIIIGGNFTYYNGTLISYIARLNSDGSLDTSFNVDNRLGELNNKVSSIAIQQDGKILVGGNFNAYNFEAVGNVSRGGIARLNRDGSLDSSFLATGYGAGKYSDTIVNSIAVQRDGKIIIGGYFYSYNETSRGNIARLNPDGSLDASFLSTGSGANDVVSSITVLSDEKILIGGRFTAYNDTSRGNIARLNPDGSLDTAFLSTGAGGNNRVTSIAVQRDGKILICGAFTNYNSVARGRIARLNSDGSLDAGFLRTGTGSTNNEMCSITVQADGKILAGGALDQYNGVACGNIVRLIP